MERYILGDTLINDHREGFKLGFIKTVNANDNLTYPSEVTFAKSKLKHLKKETFC